MKSIFRSLIICIIGIGFALLSACNVAADRKKYIPADAIAVVSLNGSKLGKKIAWEVLFSGDLFKNLKSDDIKNTGIDLMNSFYVFALPDQRLTDKLKFVVIIPLNNQKEWAAFLKTKFPGLQETTEDGFQRATLQDNLIAGWNNKTALLVISPGNYGFEESNTTAILQETLDATLKMDEKDAVTSNEQFQLLQKDNFDLGFWINYERLSQSMPQNAMGMAAAFTAQSTFTRDAYMTGGINFEKGKISGDFKYYSNPSMQGIMKQLITENHNDDLVKRIPPGKVAAVINYHINPMGIRSMLDTLGTITFLNDALESQGLSIDGILQCFTGDFLFSAADVMSNVILDTFSFNGQTDTFTRKETSANWMLSFKVADQQAMERLLQKFIDEEIIIQETENLYSIKGSQTLLALSDGYAVLTAKEQNIRHFFSGPGAPRADIPAEVIYNPMGIFIDWTAMSPVLDSRFGSLSASGKMQALPTNMVFYGGAMKNDFAEMHMDINFSQKEENSLFQIIRAISENSKTP